MFLLKGFHKFRDPLKLWHCYLFVCELYCRTTRKDRLTIQSLTIHLLQSSDVLCNCKTLYNFEYRTDMKKKCKRVNKKIRGQENSN